MQRTGPKVYSTGQTKAGVLLHSLTGLEPRHGDSYYATSIMQLSHYTDVHALRSILETGNLWLTDIRYLNDSNEYREGEEIIRDAFSTAMPRVRGAARRTAMTFLENCIASSKDSYTFVGSFSREHDLLSQWRGYCPLEGGYSLKFSAVSRTNFDLPMQECVYGMVEKRAAATALFSKALSDLRLGGQERRSKLFQTIWANIARFKNAGFAEEKECRVVVFRPADEPEAKFRSRGSQLIPYLQVAVPWRRLESICIGPCRDPHENEWSLRRFLQQLQRIASHPLHGMPLPEIRRSSVTFRG
jgi:hypothetical protein